MGVVIPDEVLETAQISAKELLQEIALLLYSQGRLTMGQASKVAQVNQQEFQHLLADHRIPLNYDLEEFERDLETLRRLKRP
jgi:predicted HTH domain antitoxin